MTQRPLDFTPYPDGLPGHAPHCDTSLAAAEAIAPHVTELQRRVLAALPGTVFEVMQRLAIDNKDTVAPRISELRALGKVVDSGERRPSPSGRACKVWRRA